MRPSSHMAEGIQISSNSASSQTRTRTFNSAETPSASKRNSASAREVPLAVASTGIGQMGNGPTTDTKMAKINDADETGSTSRRSAIVPHVQGHDAVDKVKGQLVLETRHASSNVGSCSRNTKTAPSSNDGGDRQTPTSKGEAQSPPRNCMDDSSKSRGRIEIIPERRIIHHQLRHTSDECQVPAGKNGNEERAVYDSTAITVAGDNRVCKRGQQGEQAMVVPRDHNCRPNCLPPYGQLSTGIAQPKARSPSILVKTGLQGRGVTTCIQARGTADAPEIPNIWFRLGGEQEAGHAHNGTGAKARAAAWALAYLQGTSATAPSSDTIQRVFPDLNQWQRHLYPLHVKEVTAISIPALLQLQMPQRLRKQATNYLRFLNDPSVYPKRPKLSIRNTSLSKNDELSLGRKVAQIEKQDILAGVYGFKVVEFDKHRCRPVWACDINDEHFNFHGEKILLHKHSEIAHELTKTTLFIQVDGKSMYDQFELSSTVRMYYGFTTHSGAMAALATLPAGFRFAPGAAQSTSDILAFDPTIYNTMTSSSLVHLDNFGFAFAQVGSSSYDFMDEVIQRMTRFFDRCTAVGFQLNELSEEEVRDFGTCPRDKQLATLLKISAKQFTFLGVEYEITTNGNSKAIATKTLRKLEAISAITFNQDQVNPQISYRQLAMLTGVIRHCSRILDLRHQEFNTYRTINEMAGGCAEDPTLWDKPIGTTNAVKLKRIIPLARRIANHPPVPVRRSLNLDEAHHIFVDASATGWGALHFEPRANNYTTHAQRWSRADYQSSVTAEPQALIATLRRINLPQGTTIVIASDHFSLVQTSTSVQAKAYQYFRVLTEAWPQWNIHLVFVPGKYNPADEPSRGLPITTSLSTCLALRAAAGAGAAWAFTFHQETPTVYVPTGTCLKDDYLCDDVS